MESEVEVGQGRGSGSESSTSDEKENTEMIRLLYLPLPVFLNLNQRCELPSDSRMKLLQKCIMWWYAYCVSFFFLCFTEPE